MKQYHEYASVIDAKGKLTGFLLCDTKTGEYSYADFNLFFTLVQQDKVQYFVFDEQNQLKIEYSKEELKAIGKIKNAVKSFTTLDDYLQSDVKLYKEHLDIALKYPDVCVGTGIASPQMPIVGSVLVLMLPDFGIGCGKLLKSLRVKKEIQVISENNLGCPVFAIYIPEMLMNDGYIPFFENCLFSTDALFNTPKILDVENVRKANLMSRILFKDNVNSSSLISMKNFIDKINANTFKQYSDAKLTCSTMNAF